MKVNNTYSALDTVPFVGCWVLGTGLVPLGMWVARMVAARLNAAGKYSPWVLRATYKRQKSFNCAFLLR